MTGFCLSLIFTVKGTSGQSLVVQTFDFVATTKHVLWTSNFELEIGCYACDIKCLTSWIIYFWNTVSTGLFKFFLVQHRIRRTLISQYISLRMLTNWVTNDIFEMWYFRNNFESYFCKACYFTRIYTKSRIYKRFVQDPYQRLRWNYLWCSNSEVNNF